VWKREEKAKHQEEILDMKATFQKKWSREKARSRSEMLVKCFAEKINPAVHGVAKGREVNYNL
jgi:hypothetical protein